MNTLAIVIIITGKAHKVCSQPIELANGCPFPSPNDNNNPRHISVVRAKRKLAPKRQKETLLCKIVGKLVQDGGQKPRGASQKF